MSKLIQKRPPPKKQVVYTPPDLLKVNEKDPNYTYRWIKIGDHVQIYGGQDVRGWELVRRGNSEKVLEGLLSEFSVTSLDSTYRLGDLVLARMPKEKVEARNLAYLEKNRTQMKAIKDPKKDTGVDRNKFHGSVEITNT